MLIPEREAAAAVSAAESGSGRSEAWLFVGAERVPWPEESVAEEVDSF